MKFSDLMRKPSAYLPLVMSGTALAVLVGHVLFFGPGREPDEGGAAHVFQLLIGAQVPLVMFFVVRWLPRFTKQTLAILALQTLAMIAALAPVYLLGL